MSVAGQTTETIRADFDRIASLERGGWDHNAHYHDHLLRHIPERCGKILEIGCGAGEFSRLLARRAEIVVAVDLSPRMIRAARERSRSYPNVEFVCADVTEYELPEEEFDCVATLTTMHHLPEEAALAKIAKSLRPGGVFVCLDLYRRSGPVDLLFDCVAYPSGALLRLAKTGRLRADKALREAYDEHGRTDTYLTLRQIGRACAGAMPGARVSRLLFWRYRLVWTKGLAARVTDGRAGDDRQTAKENFGGDNRRH